MTKVMNYYEVVAKCGHVGRKHYVPIKFAVMAESGTMAAKMVRQFPRVKHNHKDAILMVTKIDCDRFVEIKEINKNDRYLKCHSRREQKMIEDLYCRLEIDLHHQEKQYNKQKRKDTVAYKLKKYKILNKCNLMEVYAYAC